MSYELLLRAPTALVTASPESRVYVCVSFNIHIKKSQYVTGLLQIIVIGSNRNLTGERL